MAGIPTSDTCDVWEPTEHIQPAGSVLTPTYTRTQAALACNFRHLTAAQRLMSGLDTTQQKRKLFLYGTTAQPSDRAAFVNLTDSTIWRMDGPATYHKTPVSPGHWQVMLTEDLTPPAEISAAYS